MIEVRQRAPTQPTVAPSATLTLPFEKRQKSRLRTTLDDGRVVGLFLPRGTVLHNGDQLLGSDGTVVEVCAAPEPLSLVASDDAFALLRAAYHLGNRHVPLQIQPGRLCFMQDSVLDQMIVGLQLEVVHLSAPFEPEGGAYGGHTHEHSHEHTHEHGHEHGLDHDHHEGTER